MRRETTMLKVVTIGVYGATEEAFFRALQEADVDTFVDIRRRRGVRGSTYAYANSQRLQARLAELGIRYVHLLPLAPTEAVRDRQRAADEKLKTAKRARSVLSPAFVAAYREEILDRQTPQVFVEALPADARVVALFCVEREAAACHRSLVAEWLAAGEVAEIEHVVPGE
jgi:uncharacterized protein (DUF488 family)